jgi:outer membrane putative beta-barrel porin/alpha-amylase
MLRQYLPSLLLSCVAAAVPAAAADLQSRDDAWWTGPLLAPSGATLPQGHALIEPYLYDVMSDGHIDAQGQHHAGPYEHDIGSLTYILYGVTDRITAGVIPRFAYNEPAGAPNSSGVGVGDFTLQAAYGLTRYQDGHSVPSIALVIDETLPTGRYDHLAHPSDGYGAGAYSTALALYSQEYFWMPNGRILRGRLDLTYTWSSSVSVHDQSVYGTPYGFRGDAYPGDAFSVDLAGEYSATRNWVLALDIVYQYGASTRITSRLPAAPAYPVDTGSSYALIFAPAIEYNFSSAVGVIFGVRIIEIGRNLSTSVTPAVAVNMVF